MFNQSYVVNGTVYCQLFTKNGDEITFLTNSVIVDEAGIKLGRIIWDQQIKGVSMSEWFFAKDIEKFNFNCRCNDDFDYLFDLKILTNEQLKKRLIELSGTQEDATDLIQELINRAAELPNGDFKVNGVIAVETERCDCDELQGCECNDVSYGDI